AESRFDYSASDAAISVNVDGVISVNSIPENDVHVSIYERNTSTTAEVNVNIVGKLTKVLGITFSDSEGNKMLVSGTQDLTIGETYIIDVVTEPRNVEIEKYCFLKAVNTSGVEKNVFEFTYSKTNVSMTVVGLGTGNLQLDITNDDKQSIYETDFDFSISMYDENLSTEILNNSNATILSQDELSKIETVELSKNVSNLEGLENLISLKTIVFTSDEVMSVAHITQDYCYRVKTDLFYEYLEAENWTDYSKCIIPYEENADELFVVYHDAKTATATSAENVEYERLEGLADFPTYIFEGYTNFGWLDENNSEVSVSQVKDSVKINGIHLYAGWNPISYKVVYHIRDSAGANLEEIFYYDTEYILKVPNDIDSSISHLGYKAAGWTRNRNSDIYSPNVQYRNGEAVSNLTSEQDATIDLYDIWEPIEYTIIFSTVEGMEEIADLTAKYNTAYTLPTPSRPGYEFNYWKLNNVDTLNAGVQDPNLNSNSNLSNIDGAEIILTPDFTEITYTITFRLNGGQAPRDLTIVEGYKKSLRYTESYTLPYLTKEGYTVYSWYCDSNGKTYGSEDRIVGEFTTACEVTFSAVWTSAIYSINYDCNGGNISGESYVISNRYWDDGASLLTPTRTGYSFVEWQDAEHEMSYAPGDAGWTSNLIKSAADNGAQFNLKAIWQINYYDLTISTGTGSSLSVRVNNVAKADGTHSVAYNSTITVSYSANTGYSNATCTFTGGNMPANALTIKSSATINKHNVTISIGTGSYMTVNIGGTSYSSSKTVSVAYGTSISVTSYGANSGYESAWYSCDYSTMPDKDITISSGATKSCVATGSLVLMADGSQKAIEELKVGDMIMTWNFFTGQIQASPITIFWDHGTDLYNVINLTFSNGTNLKIIGSHGVFDSTTNSFVYINAQNYVDYIGHTFIGFGNDETQQLVLVNAQITTEMVGSYSLETACNGNAIIEGMLTLTPQEYVELFVLFEIGAELKYDTEKMQADIDKYGLYTYEEWSDIVSYDEFIAFNGQYMKIIVGKNIMSEEDLIRLINTWLHTEV
ncbi:MAG: InlB B-repeat-containing protein, partial [Lachnospiraceae bacterium]|nr:InlB B-repeat-containing protein [Lachnospiraceae bacterium]